MLELLADKIVPPNPKNVPIKLIESSTTHEFSDFAKILLVGAIRIAEAAQWLKSTSS